MIRLANEGTSLQTRAEQLHSELDRLEQVADILEEGLSDFHHQLRRVGDALLRVGGRSIELDRKARQLRENIEVGRSDLENNRAERRELAVRLCTIKNEIGPSRRGRQLNVDKGFALSGEDADAIDETEITIFAETHCHGLFCTDIGVATRGGYRGRATSMC